MTTSHRIPKLLNPYNTAEGTAATSGGLPGGKKLFADQLNDEIPASVSDRLKDLSMDERSQALYDLHGVAPIFKETPEVVKSGTETLEAELAKIPNKAAFLLARKMCGGYVAAISVVFLRAVHFDAVVAARQMVQYFELKRQLFGEELLTACIKLDDLPEEARKWQKEGLVQLLPRRDQAGRALVFVHGKTALEAGSLNTLLNLFFITNASLRDEDIQKRGIVLIFYCVGQRRFVDVENFPNFISAIQCMPFRLVATHFCYNNAKLNPLVNIVQFAFDKWNLCRFRSHFGTHMECQYALMTFGIAKDLIPVSPDGYVNVTRHQTRLKYLEKMHAGAVSAIIIQVPGPMDIINGRGRHGQNSPGNMRFKHMLEENRIAYDEGDKKARAMLVDSMISDLKNTGCRFVQFEESQFGWVEVGEDTVKAKVAHAFRNLRPDVSSSNVSKASNRAEKNSSPSLVPITSNKRPNSAMLDSV